MEKDIRSEARRLASQNLTLPQLLVVDALTMLCSLLPVAAAWGGTLIYLQRAYQQGWFVWAALSTPLVLPALFLIAVWIVRLAIPPVRPGTYDIGLSKGYVTWYIILCLGHSVRIAGLHPFFFAFYTPKYLYFRAMGADVAYGVNSSIFAMFADYPMLKIGKGSTVGADAFILGHMFVGKKVMIGKVEIGENVFVGAYCLIGTETKIGDNTWIGMNNRLMRETLPPDSRLENFERMDLKRSAPAAKSEAAAVPVAAEQE